MYEETLVNIVLNFWGVTIKVKLVLNVIRDEPKQNTVGSYDNV